MILGIAKCNFSLELNSKDSMVVNFNEGEIYNINKYKNGNIKINSKDSKTLKNISIKMPKSDYESLFYEIDLENSEENPFFKEYNLFVKAYEDFETKLFNDKIIFQKNRPYKATCTYNNAFSKFIFIIIDDYDNIIELNSDRFFDLFSITAAKEFNYINEEVEEKENDNTNNNDSFIINQVYFAKSKKQFNSITGGKNISFNAGMLYDLHITKKSDNEFNFSIINNEQEINYSKDSFLEKFNLLDKNMNPININNILSTIKEDKNTEKEEIINEIDTKSDTIENSNQDITKKSLYIPIEERQLSDQFTTTIANIYLCGLLIRSVKESERKQFRKPNKLQLKNLHDKFGIDVELTEAFEANKKKK